MIVYVILIGFLFVLLFVDRLIVVKRFAYTTIGNSFVVIDSNPPAKQARQFSFTYKLALLTIFCFTAFRFNVGWDYIAYYNTIKYYATTNIVSNGEYLNIFLIEMSRKLNMTNLYFFVNALIVLFFTFRTIKDYSKDIWLSLLFFVGFPLFFLNSLSVIRLFSAVAISFYGFRFMESRKFYRYAITILIASMFHKSAIISLMFYFLKDLKLKTYKQGLILTILPILSTLINKFVINFVPRYSVYTELTSVQEGTKAIVVFVVLGIFSLFFRERITRNDNIANMYYNLFYVGLCVYLMFLKQGTMGHRLSLYGTIYSLLLVPHLVSLFKDGKERAFLKMIIYTFCVVAFLFTVYVGAETYIPYKTICSRY